MKARILNALQGFPVVYVSGPRQAGKSTLVQQIADCEWPAEYVTFDEATMLGAAETNPESFLRAFEQNVGLDEIQMVPRLFRVLKLLVDEFRRTNHTGANGRFLLTGSASIMALPKLSDALVGRISVLTLYPLSALELTQGEGNFLFRLLSNDFKPETIKRDHKHTEIIRGATFPEIRDKTNEQRRQWFEAYITTILQRDVRQLANIAKLGILPNLLKVLAARAGGLINEADIARTIDQNAVTTKNYRILLHMLHLSIDIKPWFRNIDKRLVKAPKGYIVDTSLLCHLQQIDLDKAESYDPLVFGRLFENFVVSELLKQLTSSECSARIYHFRTSDNKEVDIVLEQPNGKLAGIEIKSRDQVTASNFKGLRELHKQTGNDFVCGVVLYRGNKLVPFGDKLWAVPVDLLWS